jgi:hypothetical protein
MSSKQVILPEIGMFAVCKSNKAYYNIRSGNKNYHVLLSVGKRAIIKENEIMLVLDIKDDLNNDGKKIVYFLHAEHGLCYVYENWGALWWDSALAIIKA